MIYFNFILNFICHAFLLIVLCQTDVGLSLYYRLLLLRSMSSGVNIRDVYSKLYTINVSCMGMDITVNLYELCK